MGRLARALGMAIAMALPAAALAGCASSASVLSKADFIRQSDAICRAANTAVAGVAPPATGTPSDEASYLKQTVAITEPELQKLAALTAAPSDFAVLEQNLIAPSRDLVAAAHTFVSEVQQAAGESAGEQAALTKYTAAAADPNKATHDKALADFGFGACATASTGPPPTSTTTTAPPAPFVARDSGFSAVFPMTPTRRVLGTTQSVIFYQAVTADEEVSVTYGLLPATPSALGGQRILDNSITQGAAAVSGTVTSMSRITWLGAPAEDGVITSPGHVVHVRVVILGRKLYVLQGITYAADAPHPQYDELLATFRTI